MEKVESAGTYYIHEPRVALVENTLEAQATIGAVSDKLGLLSVGVLVIARRAIGLLII